MATFELVEGSRTFPASLLGETSRIFLSSMGGWSTAPLASSFVGSNPEALILVSAQYIRDYRIDQTIIQECTRPSSRQSCLLDRVCGVCQSGLQPGAVMTTAAV